VKNVIFIFPLLFIFELIFGVSGTMIMVGGVAIRHILFILTFISLYGYILFYLIKNKIKIFSTKEGSFLGSFNCMDIFAVVFEISMLMSMTVIPYIKGTNLHYAYSEVFDSAAIFSLYFAVSYLIKEKQIDMRKLMSYLKLLIFIFAVEHLIFYFGQEMSEGFIEGFFEFFENLVRGHGIVQKVVLGHGGYTRVVFNTSIYLLVGISIFFYNFRGNKWYDYLFFCVEILAIITTVMKSIWLGAGIALIIVIVFGFFYAINKECKVAIKFVLTGIAAVLLVVGTDSMIFNGIVKVRMSNAFITENITGDDKNILERIDAEGAAESNAIKIEQIGELLEKWKGSPIVGYGYGSYVENYLRSEEAPFSYEMQFFSLLMKIGVIGLVIWLAFFALQFIVMIKIQEKDMIHIIGWLFLLISMVISVQTNPLLISFTGMSVLLFLSLLSVYECCGIDKRSDKSIDEKTSYNIGSNGGI
jgi:hypothetical protein